LHISYQLSAPPPPSLLRKRIPSTPTDLPSPRRSLTAYAGPVLATDPDRHLGCLGIISDTSRPGVHPATPPPRVMSETTSVRRQARAQAQQALAGSTAHVGEGEAEPVRKQQKKRRRPHRLLVCAVVGVTLLLCMAASAHVRARSMHRVTGVGSRASLLRRDDGNSSDSDQPVEVSITEIADRLVFLHANV
jgi:hypothetical protein